MEVCMHQIGEGRRTCEETALFGSKAVGVWKRVRARFSRVQPTATWSTRRIEPGVMSSTTASQTELKANRVPIAWRDGCSAYVLSRIVYKRLLTGYVLFCMIVVTPVAWNPIPFSCRFSTRIDTIYALLEYSKFTQLYGE
jgi:hypothetical protein